jgi:hypothetical protein
MKQHNKYFQYALVFFFLIVVNIGNLVAQEQGRILIIKGCPEFSTFPDILIINAKNRDELIQLFVEEDDDLIEAAIVAATEAEALIQREDIVVGILYEFHEGMTEKPWNGLGTYFILLEGGDNWYLSKVKKNMGTEVIVMNFADFSRL